MQRITFIISIYFLIHTHTFATVSSEKTVLLQNVNIIDMVSEEVRKGDLLLRDELIVRVAYDEPIKPPLGAITYDLTGKYLIPGLIDSHVHITHGTYDDAVKALNTALKNGITGVRDMGGDGRMLAQLKRAALIGEIASSDVFFSALIAGELFYKNDPRPAYVALGANVGNESWQWTVDEDTDFANIISQSKGLGVSAIKVYARVDKEVFQKVADEAKKQGLKVWSHASIPPMRPSEIINAGSNVVSHAGSFLQYEIAEEIKDRYDFNDSKEELEQYRSALRELPFDANTPKVKAVFDSMVENGTVLDATLWVYQIDGRPKNQFKYATKVTQMAYEAGVKIGAGTDGLNHENGYVSNIHLELELLNKAGLPAIDVLRAATINNAVGLGEEALIGTIEENKLANLVVLNANPLEDIRNTRSIELVFKRGIAHNGYPSLWFVK